MYYLTGTLLAVLGLIALVALLLGMPIAGSSPYNWALFVGVGVTLVLWLTVLYVSQLGLKMLRQKA